MKMMIVDLLIDKSIYYPSMRHSHITFSPSIVIEAIVCQVFVPPPSRILTKLRHCLLISIAKIMKHK